MVHLDDYRTRKVSPDVAFGRVFAELTGGRVVLKDHNGRLTFTEGVVIGVEDMDTHDLALMNERAVEAFRARRGR